MRKNLRSWAPALWASWYRVVERANEETMVAGEGPQEREQDRRKMHDNGVTHHVRRVIWAGWQCFCATEIFIESYEDFRRAMVAMFPILGARVHQKFNPQLRPPPGLLACRGRVIGCDIVRPRWATSLLSQRCS